MTRSCQARQYLGNLQLKTRPHRSPLKAAAYILRASKRYPNSRAYLWSEVQCTRQPRSRILSPDGLAARGRRGSRARHTDTRDGGCQAAHGFTQPQHKHGTVRETSRNSTSLKNTQTHWSASTPHRKRRITAGLGDHIIFSQDIHANNTRAPTPSSGSKATAVGGSPGGAQMALR